MAKIEFVKAQALRERISVYYPYMDPEFIQIHPMEPERQALYLKVLSLVTDLIIVPPSHILHFHNVTSVFNGLYELLEMEDGGIISSVSQRDRDFSDFLERKRSYYSGIGKSLGQKHYDQAKSVLSKCSHGIHRNVQGQMKGFREGLLAFFTAPTYPKFATQKSDYIREVVSSKPELMSRSALINFLNGMANDIKPRFYQAFLDCMRIEYFKQGGFGNCSVLPPIATCLTQSEMTEYLSNSELEQLHIYDPKLVLSVLSLLGIPPNAISQLSAKDIVELRCRDVFRHFITQYKKLVTEANRIGSEKLEHALYSHFQKQRRKLNVTLGIYKKIGSIFLAGFSIFLSQNVLGAFAGLIPYLPDILGYTNSLDNLKKYILDRVYATKYPMAVYDSFLQSIIDNNTFKNSSKQV